MAGKEQYQSYVFVLEEHIILHNIYMSVMLKKKAFTFFRFYT